MAGWFELDKSSNGQYKFVLKAGNGEVVLTSELYTTQGGGAYGKKGSPRPLSLAFLVLRHCFLLFPRECPHSAPAYLSGRPGPAYFTSSMAHFTRQLARGNILSQYTLR